MADKRAISDDLLSHTGYMGVDLAAMADIGTDGWTHDPGTYTTPLEILQQDTAANNNTKTLGWRMPPFRLPGHFCDSASIDSAVESATLYDLTLNVSARRTGTPNTSMVLRAKVYEVDNQGAHSGSNLYSGGDINLLSTSVNTWAVHQLAIGGSLAVRGDALQAFLEVAQDDTGGSGGGIFELGAVWWSFNER